MFYTEAQDILLNAAHSFGKETVPLEQAFGRVLCDKITADRDYPPFNRAAMDGYALRFEDFEKGQRSFTVNETIFAGQIPATTLAPNQCYKIMTGASTPPDASLVIRREDTEEKNGTVTILVDIAKPLQNIARRGEDLHQGDTIIDKPLVATPAVISLLAAVGRQSVLVEKLPRIAIVTTGDEVISIDQKVSDVQIRNSNSWLLRSLLHKQGIQPFSVDHVPDEPAALQNAFKQALNADIIISCGGVSAGDADFVPGALAALGVEKLFHKLMIRPGKPIWCGKTADKKMVFALPGNPLSCMVTFCLFVQPFLHACYGLPSPTTILLALQGKRSKKTNLDEFFPVKIIPGAAAVQIVPFNGSGDIRAALFADGFARHPREKTVINAGEPVEFLPILLS
jgi:molybdopterin molybdotransferase